MSKNLGYFDRFARVFGGSILLLLSVFVFTHPVGRLLAILFGLWGVLEGISGHCPLYYYLGQHKPGAMKPEMVVSLSLTGIQVVFGYVWWSAGWEKITDNTFIPGLAKVLTAWATKNPYPLVHDFLLTSGVKYAQLFGFFVAFGEYLIGVVLIALAYAWLTARSEETRRASLYISAICYAIGAVMSAVFYLAAGHSSPSTHTVNVLMFWVQALLFYAYIMMLVQKNGRAR
jgi:hypothetical protein